MLNNKNVLSEFGGKTVVSEYVGFGHSDKVADQIGDALLDEYLRHDPQTRAGIEVMVKDNFVVLGGEVTAAANIDCDAVVREVFAHLPYPANHHLSPREIKVINLIGQQSPEISKGVDHEDGEIGSGDQGFMVGYASNETPDYLPLGVHMAKKICQHVAHLTDNGYGPDCKSQVIVNYDEAGRATIPSILVSTMHQNSLEEVRQEITDIIANNAMGLDEQLFARYFQDNQVPKITVNPCGEWHIGGSVSDCGVTGRKIVVDQFGGYVPVGGGNLHTKDMSKVDRSAAYMARYLAKNIVATGIADTCRVELSYMIGSPQPSSVFITVNRNQQLVPTLIAWVRNHVDLSVKSIITRFDGSCPRYYNTAVNGHYGKTDQEMLDPITARLYPWEKIDLVAGLNL